jgi:hypothetical protein
MIKINNIPVFLNLTVNAAPIAPKNTRLRLPIANARNRSNNDWIGICNIKPNTGEKRLNIKPPLNQLMKTFIPCNK